MFVLDWVFAEGAGFEPAEVFTLIRFPGVRTRPTMRPFLLVK